MYRYDGRPTSRGEAMLRQVEKYGVPYPQAGVLSRVKKLVDVAVGKTSMKRVRSFVGGSTTACPHQDDAFA